MSNEYINWEDLDDNLKNINFYSDYQFKIEEITYKILENIFSDGKITKENNKMAKIIYDFLIDMKDQKLFCEIKFEKTSLAYYWENYVSDISKYLEEKNKNPRRRKKLKYLLILIESKDSSSKLNLDPIFSEILVINLKSLIAIRNYTVHGVQNNLIYNLIKHSYGILYDDFINNFLRNIDDIQVRLSKDHLKSMNFNREILNINYIKFLNNLKT